MRNYEEKFNDVPRQLDSHDDGKLGKLDGVSGSKYRVVMLFPEVSLMPPNIAISHSHNPAVRKNWKEHGSWQI